MLCTITRGFVTLTFRTEHFDRLTSLFGGISKVGEEASTSQEPPTLCGFPVVFTDRLPQVFGPSPLLEHWHEYREQQRANS